MRGDIPLEHQIVQACHASHEAGRAQGTGDIIPSLVMIKVKDKQALIEAAREISEHVMLEMFYEPDWDYGQTAFATEMVSFDERRHFRKYKLWKC